MSDNVIVNNLSNKQLKQIKDIVKNQNSTRKDILDIINGIVVKYIKLEYHDTKQKINILEYTNDNFLGQTCKALVKAMDSVDINVDDLKTALYNFMIVAVLDFDSKFEGYANILDKSSNVKPNPDHYMDFFKVCLLRQTDLKDNITNQKARDHLTDVLKMELKPIEDGWFTKGIPDTKNIGLYTPEFWEAILKPESNKRLERDINKYMNDQVELPFFSTQEESKYIIDKKLYIEVNEKINVDVDNNIFKTEQILTKIFKSLNPYLKLNPKQLEDLTNSYYFIINKNTQLVIQYIHEHNKRMQNGGIGKPNVSITRPIEPQPQFTSKVYEPKVSSIYTGMTSNILQSNKFLKEYYDNNIMKYLGIIQLSNQGVELKKKIPESDQDWFIQDMLNFAITLNVLMTQPNQQQYIDTTMLPSTTQFTQFINKNFDKEQRHEILNSKVSTEYDFEHFKDMVNEHIISTIDIRELFKNQKHILSTQQFDNIQVEHKKNKYFLVEDKLYFEDDQITQTKIKQDIFDINFYLSCFTGNKSRLNDACIQKSLDTYFKQFDADKLKKFLQQDKQLPFVFKFLVCMGFEMEKGLMVHPVTWEKTIRNKYHETAVKYDKQIIEFGKEISSQDIVTQINSNMSVILRQTFDNKDIPDDQLFQQQFFEYGIPKTFKDSLGKEYSLNKNSYDSKMVKVATKYQQKRVQQSKDIHRVYDPAISVSMNKNMPIKLEVNDKFIEQLTDSRPQHEKQRIKQDIEQIIKESQQRINNSINRQTDPDIIKYAHNRIVNTF